ncbi:uncharacterized protein LOC114878804 isoform X1 [Osmia bicornis bicornis]|uniref:uncharacterized protein LOC114878804 isoform X1 n=2 Tax=Osmia bicornis bicornis TaxID=1437191 RepID=UPI0010F9672B|nr:uncharacterized protein LOC114878804 isoform X1 [Osmia bicornis bicornis]
MVSPSKIQHQEHKQSPREKKLSKHSHGHTQKDLKPLEGKSFYLDIKNHATTTKIESKIKDLGGVIELFLVRSVHLVISDRVDKSGYINFEKHKWGCASGGSGGPPSLRSLETPTPMPTPPTPFFSPECPLSNTTNIRGQTTQRSKSRVDAMLERALTQPQQCSVDPLYNAQSWGIPIWAIDKLQVWLDKIYASIEDTNHLKRLKRSNQQSSTKELKVRHLKGPYLKFESFQRNTRPVFVELPVWPTLNFHGDPGSCPFNTKRREKLEKLRKEVKENREGIQRINREEDKEMTRRPRTTARTRRTEQLVSGYCEICRISYRDLSKHVQSDQHLSFVQNDDNFLSLDTLINAGANVEAFLKLNRTKDIEKDCNLFSNGDRNLHDSVLPEGKVTRNSKSLGDFDVEDVKMGQCNGNRRNLNLKLSSPHNLRTRAKHESGHLLRSKGSPWHEVDKAEKFYDKFEGFTIKKRAKGTIWIEEDEPGDNFAQEDELKESKHNEYKIKTFTAELDEKCNDERNCNIVCNKRKDPGNQVIQRAVVTCGGEEDSVGNTECIKQERSPIKNRNYEHINGSIKNNCSANTLSTNDHNGFESCRVCRSETSKELNYKVQLENTESGTKKLSETCEINGKSIICNGHTIKEEQKIDKALNDTEKNETKDDKPRYLKTVRRGGRSTRGRHRLSVEERLIEDNRAYYKVEVLGSKLRSSVLSNNNSQCTVQKEGNSEEKKEVPSSEKPVVVRFKRVRKSELSLLSDEAESFMFGELKRDDSSEISDGDQSSFLPRDTESECNGTGNSICPSSSLDSSSFIKSETVEEDSQDSVNLGRARKRRRTQAEALIKDNVDYYKFETPGSRLRYQAPLTGIKESSALEQTEKIEDGINTETVQKDVEKVYPSKPSPEVEKMQFSFEAIPKSEPWYQTYQRQDNGAEFWHYFSEGDTQKPFLLPYEIENFHEILLKNQSRNENKKKGRGRSAGCIGRSPRKSPRCHASTLAIMSTIIRKREQQHRPPNSCTMEECQPTVRLQTNASKPDQKVELKSDIDEELKEMVKTIDEMLNANDDHLELADSFEPDGTQMELNPSEATIPKGPPPNLLELLDTCHEIANCLENSSCASSECGEGNVESPLKRRKKRKNRTGWPGNKMKKKLQSKPLAYANCERRNLLGKGSEENQKNCNVQVTTNSSNGLTEEADTRIVRSVGSIGQDAEQILSFDERKTDGCLFEMYTTSVNEPNEKKDQSIEILDNSVLHINAEARIDSIASDICNETDRDFVLNENYTFRKDLPEVIEISENDPGNDENHENVFRKDVNSISERRFISKAAIKKRQRDNTSSETCESRVDLEKHEILCRKDELPRKRQPKNHSEISDTEIVHRNNVYKKGRVTSRKRIYPKKRAKKNNVSSGAVFDDENCKKDSYLSITCKKQSLKSVKRQTDTVSSEARDSDVECTLSSRVSPTIITSSELKQRRSSIEFQPVVRMMKIDDQVETDHSILSVTIASNRRLRSSSSSRSNAQPPKKRLKTSRGQFGRWLKNS